MADAPEVVTSEIAGAVSTTDHPLIVDKAVVLSELDAARPFKAPEEKKEEAKEPPKEDEKKDEPEFITIDGVPIPKPVFDKIAHKRVGKATAKQREAERLMASYMSQVAERDAKIAELMKKLEPADKEPEMDQYESVDEWKKALLDWHGRQNQKPEPETSQEQPELSGEQLNTAYLEAMSPESKKNFNNQLDQALKDGAEKYPDFKETVGNKDVPLSAPLLSLLTQGDMEMHEVMYYLGKNPDLAADLNEASVRAAYSQDWSSALRLLGKIESKIEAGFDSGPAPAPVKTPEPPKPPKVTKAPEPIQPVSSRGAPVNQNAEELATDPEAYRAWRKGGGGR